MKHLFLYSFAIPGIIIPFISGCQSPCFAEKGLNLSHSRKVGYQKPSLQEQPAVNCDFTSETELQKFQVVNGKWEISDGKLLAVSGKHNRSILLGKVERTPLRIELEVTNYANPDGSIGDITILINSENSDHFFRKGYALTTGSYYNNCTTFYRLGKPLANTEYSPLVSGKTYQVVVEFNHGNIRYWLDDKIILEAWDPAPLKLDPNLWVGIRTWNTRMSVENFTVYQGTEKK